jgi:phage gp29-like protein
MLWLDKALAAVGLAPKPDAGIRVQGESADTAGADVSRELTPERVDRIMVAANVGETMDYCRLAMELDEKNWDIAQAVATRRQAVAGLDWGCEAQDNATDKTDKTDGRAEEIAEAAEEMLRGAQPSADGDLVSFEQGLFGGLNTALLPGVACCELVWDKGGAALLGMQPIEARHLVFRDELGRILGRPRLVTTGTPNGIELPLGKFALHFHQPRSGARCRGGLIRPLAWLHCFQNVNIKDLLTFIERYGMPFLITKVSPDAWATERTKLKALVRAFGPAGGAVLTENVQAELLQASNNTGDVYFRLLEYCGDAITKVVLGQLASSAASTGLSGGDAQSAVRQDILEADCRALAETVRAEILRPWVIWNYGPDAPVPCFKLKSEPPEDIKATADTAASLFSAGLEWDEEEASERMGMKLTRKAPPPPVPFGQTGMPPAVGEARSPEPPRLGDAAADPAGDGRVAAAPGAEPSTAEETQPGIGRPSTAKKQDKAGKDAVALTADASRPQDSSVSSPAGYPPSAGPSRAQDHPADLIADAVARQVTANRGLDDWFAPVRIAVEFALRGNPDPETLKVRLERLLGQLPELAAQVDGAEFAAAVQTACLAAYASGFDGEAKKIAS